jgi:hypothetical protein
MAMYLNEDDILKPGQANHVMAGNHGILKFCSKDDTGTEINKNNYFINHDRCISLLTIFCCVQFYFYL